MAVGLYGSGSVEGEGEGRVRGVRNGSDDEMSQKHIFAIALRQFPALPIPAARCTSGTPRGTGTPRGAPSGSPRRLRPSSVPLLPFGAVFLSSSSYKFCVQAALAFWCACCLYSVSRSGAGNLVSGALLDNYD